MNSLTKVSFCVLHRQLSSGRSNMSLYLPIQQIIYYVHISYICGKQLKQGGSQHISAPHFNLQKCLLYVRLDFETTVECCRTC